MRPFILVGMLFLIAGCTSEPDNHDHMGNPIHYADNDGKYLLINYWADWCAPCLEEIPELNRLAMERQDLRILGISFDELSPEELNRQITQLGIEFPVLVADPSAQLGFAPPDVLPTSYLLTSDLVVKSTLVGPQSYEDIAAQLH